MTDHETAERLAGPHGGHFGPECYPDQCDFEKRVTAIEKALGEVREDSSYLAARALEAIRSFVTNRGRHEGNHVAAKYVTCLECDKAYIEAETRLDEALAAMSNAWEGK